MSRKLPWMKMAGFSVLVSYADAFYHYDGVGDPLDDMLRFFLFAPILAVAIFVCLLVGSFVVFGLLRFISWVRERS